MLPNRRGVGDISLPNINQIIPTTYFYFATLKLKNIVLQQIKQKRLILENFPKV